MYKSWNQLDSDEQDSKKVTPCSPREELNVHMWSWDSNLICKSTLFSCEDRQVDFHSGYSAGTAAARGNTPFVAGHDYFWEIKMLSSIYGTDVMVGIGTAQCDVRGAMYHFCSLLGRDKESWGFSYSGSVFHGGIREKYGQSFNSNDIVGIHLDTWHGNLSFYVNGSPLGIAFQSINCQEELYPMVCSTAAYSSMKLIYSYSRPWSLQSLCLQTLSPDSNQIKVVTSVPGLAKLAVRHLLDDKSFAPETVFSDEDSESKVNGLLIEDVNEDCASAIKTVFDLRRRKRRRCSLNMTNVLQQADEDLRELVVASSSAPCMISSSESRDCCNVCGTRFRPNVRNELLRPMTRRQVLSSLCNLCSVIL